MVNILFDKKLSVEEPKMYADVLRSVISFLMKSYTKKTSKLLNKFKEEVENDGINDEIESDNEEREKKSKKIKNNGNQEKIENIENTQQNTENDRRQKIFETKRVSSLDHNSDNDSSDHEYSELLYYSLNTISTPIKSIDEHLFFAESIKFIESIGVSLINICNFLEKGQTEYLKSSIFVRTIHIVLNGKTYSIPRKIIKAKRIINK